ncbi:hypothetical protein HDU76_001470 [Blyttiomyces sp. JEL0837]|nr:hypothetical protein HDU76_001470 [Blyttiomyces sp. JEL0837]
MDNYDINPSLYRLGFGAGCSALPMAAGLYEFVGGIDVINILLDFATVSGPVVETASNRNWDNKLLAIQSSAATGHLDNLMHLWNVMPMMERDGPCPEALLAVVVTNGHVDVVEWLTANWPCSDLENSYSEFIDLWGLYFENPNMRSVTFGQTTDEGEGRLRILKCFVEGMACDANDEDAAFVMAELCHVQCVEYLLSKRTEPFANPYDENAARSGAVEFIKHRLGLEQNDRISLDRIKFIMTHNIQSLFPSDGQWLKGLHLRRSRGFNLDIVVQVHRLCQQHSIAFSAEDLLTDSSVIRFLHVVKYIINNGLGGNTCRAASLTHAASMGLLPVVQFLYRTRAETCVKGTQNRGCQNCVKLPMEAAALHGHLFVLQWLYEQQGSGYRTAHLMPWVERGKHEHIMRWIREKCGMVQA